MYVQGVKKGVKLIKFRFFFVYLQFFMFLYVQSFNILEHLRKIMNGKQKTAIFLLVTRENKTFFITTHFFLIKLRVCVRLFQNDLLKFSFHSHNHTRPNFLKRNKQIDKHLSSSPFFIVVRTSSVPVLVHQKFMTRFLISRQGLSKLFDLKSRRRRRATRQDKWKRKWYWGNFSPVNSSTCSSSSVWKTMRIRGVIYKVGGKLLRGLINFFLLLIHFLVLCENVRKKGVSVLNKLVSCGWFVVNFVFF